MFLLGQFCALSRPTGFVFSRWLSRTPEAVQVLRFGQTSRHLSKLRRVRGDHSYSLRKSDVRLGEPYQAHQGHPTLSYMNYMCNAMSTIDCNCFKKFISHFCWMMPLFSQSSKERQFPEAENDGFRQTFQGIEDPRKSYATKRDLIELLVISLLAKLTDNSSCTAFAPF